jgi:hypothetical protein
VRDWLCRCWPEVLGMELPLTAHFNGGRGDLDLGGRRDRRSLDYGN